MNTITTLLMALTMLLPVPMVWLHLQNLWRYEHYQFAPLVLVVVALCMLSQLFSETEAGSEGRKRSRQRSRVPTTYFFTSILALIAGMITFGVGVYKLSPWLGMIGYLLLLGGFMCWYVPMKRGSGWLGTWLLCWLLVPLPLGWDQTLIEQLQSWSSRLSSRFLDVSGFNHLMQGNLLQLPGKELFVDEACSGVQSFFSLLFLVGVYSLIMRRTWLQGLLLLTTVLPWSVVMNTVRIYGIVLLDGKIPYDLSKGTPHEIWGTLVFILTFVFMLSTEQFILFFTSTVKVKNVDYLDTEIVNNHLAETRMNVANPEADQQGLLGLVNISKLVASSILAGLMVFLVTPQVRGVVPQLTFYTADQPEVVYRAKQLDTLAMELGEQSLPEMLGECQRVRFKTDMRGLDSIYGHYSHVWSYTLGNKLLQFSVDFPFHNEVHDLTKCYRGQGWQIATYHEHKPMENNESIDPYLVFNIINQLEEHGTVLSSSLDPESVYRSGFRSKHADTLSAKSVSPGKPLPSGAYYQVQLLIHSPEKLTEQEIQTCGQLYQQVREMLRQALKVSE